MNEINTLINKLENLNIDDNLILKVKDNGLKYIVVIIFITTIHY